MTTSSVKTPAGLGVLPYQELFGWSAIFVVWRVPSNDACSALAICCCCSSFCCCCRRCCCRCCCSSSSSSSCSSFSSCCCSSSSSSSCCCCRCCSIRMALLMARLDSWTSYIAIC
ncbi:unnamed protein product [Polarella glacialis]|uniref:Uncharacterized protein n=1 Tax=Polarella glacialis TaxID=89957 RepID=A0A813G6K1_POLGL|nr:unnamed protein product [Polarella glacialis]